MEIMRVLFEFIALPGQTNAVALLKWRPHLSNLFFLPNKQSGSGAATGNKSHLPSEVALAIKILSFIYSSVSVQALECMSQLRY